MGQEIVQVGADTGLEGGGGSYPLPLLPSSPPPPKPQTSLRFGRRSSFFHGMEMEQNQQSPSIKPVLPRVVRQDVCEGWRFSACVTPRVVIAGRNQRLSERHCACCPEHAGPSPHPREGGSVRKEGGCFSCFGLCQLPEGFRGFFAPSATTSRHCLPLTSSG